MEKIRQGRMLALKPESQNKLHYILKILRDGWLENFVQRDY